MGGRRLVLHGQHEPRPPRAQLVPQLLRLLPGRQVGIVTNVPPPPPRPRAIRFFQIFSHFCSRGFNNHILHLERHGRSIRS